MMYDPTCPNCGAALEVITLDGAHPPFGCSRCARAWWEVELENREEWDPHTRSFPASVRLEAETEHATAAIRGMSITPRSLQYVSDEVLATLTRRGAPGDGMRELAQATQRVRRSR